MTPRVRHEWRARIAAEYTSAAIAQQVTLWLIQAGAPPDLIDAGLAIVRDELEHSRLSHDVYVAAGGTEPPALVREQLGLERRSEVLELDLLAAIVQVFCLGETVAVPLFRHLRERCTEPAARAALDRILRDEVRHRDFGWDTLDWLWTTTIGDQIAAWVTEHWPALHAELVRSYGIENPVVAADRSDLPSEQVDVELAWGLAPPRDYAAILERTVEKDYRPRFASRGINI
ncbi:MAG: ferritin-like domain-containing protein [Kofleriaceae bacterium]